jgi:PAS domain S-box-containing protein
MPTERLRFLGNMLDAVQVAVIVTDRQGRIELWNRFAEQMYGWTSDEAMGRSIAELLMPTATSEASLAIERTTGGERTATEFVLTRRDGTTFPAETRATPMVDENGRVIGIVGVSWDISEKKRAEAERAAAQRELEQSRRHLLEAQRLAHVGSGERDLLTDRVVLSEESLRIFFGDATPPPLDQYDDFMSLVHPDDRERLRAARVASIATGEFDDVEYRVVRPDGTVRTIYNRTRMECDAEGRPVRVHGSNLDITERRIAEQRLGQRVRQQAAVAELGLRALGGASLQAIFDQAAELVLHAFDADFANVMERLPDGSALLFRAGAGRWQEGAIGHATVTGEPGGMGRFVMDATEPVIVERMAEEIRFAPCPLLVSQGIVSGVSVRIHGKPHPFGVLGVHVTKERAFDEEDLSSLWSIAHLLAVTIERTRAEEELREKRQQLQALSHRLLETQEAERRALALELHDDLGQFLTAIRLNLQAIGGDGRIRESVALVDEAIERVRGLALELRPSILDDLGLVAALRWLLNRQARVAGFVGKLLVRDSNVALPPVIATCCFRVTQEALTNVARHAGAKAVTVELYRDRDAIVVAVQDDGAGFDVRAARERAVQGGDCLGLVSMEERVRLAGGSLEIESSAGTGTSVRARLPILEEK